ncbi:MAG: hypothetical protein ABI379_00530 [Rhodanobacter sp.]
MRHRSIVTAGLLCAALLAPVAQAWPQHQHVDAAAAAPEHAPVPVPTQRWTPDGPLRTGMRRAHQAVAELRHAQMGHMSAAMTRDRAATVESAVTFMFAHCKLSAQPDAALHGILVPLLTAAQALKVNPADTRQVDVMREALEQYPRYFNDPGWDAPAPSEAQQDPALGAGIAHTMPHPFAATFQSDDSAGGCHAPLRMHSRSAVSHGMRSTPCCVSQAGSNSVSA